MRRNFIVGLLFFVAMGFLLTITAITSNVDISGTMKHYRVRFDDVRGLRVGNKVRVAGLDVGLVERLELIDGKVEASLKVEPVVLLRHGVVDPESGELSDGYEIIVRDLSLLGGKFVDVLEGQKGEEVTAGELLVGRPAPEFLKDLSEVVDENRESFNQIVNHFRNVARRLDEGKGLLQTLINDAAWKGKVDEIVNNVEDLTENLAEISQDLNDGKGSLGKILREEELYNDLRGLSAELKEVAEKVNRGDGLAGRLVNDGALADTAAAIVQDVREVARMARTGPGALNMILADETFRGDLSAVASGARRIVDSATDGNGTIAMLLNDKKLPTDVRETVSEVREMVRDVRDAEGPLGMLISDTNAREELRDVIAEAQRAIVEVRESIEDTREQAPISAFTGIIFSAF